MSLQHAGQKYKEAISKQSVAPEVAFAIMSIRGKLNNNQNDFLKITTGYCVF